VLPGVAGQPSEGRVDASTTDGRSYTINVNFGPISAVDGASVQRLVKTREFRDGVMGTISSGIERSETFRAEVRGKRKV